MLYKKLVSALAACSLLLGGYTASDEFGHYGKMSRRKLDQAKAQAERAYQVPEVKARSYRNMRFYNDKT